MSKKDKYNEKLDNTEELEKLYRIYIRVQSGDKSALDELFKVKEIDIDNERICRLNERYKKRQISNLDNVLDAEFVIENEKENEKSKQKDNWLNSSDSIVDFAFPMLNKMIYNMKRDFLKKEKDVSRENKRCSKFYSGEYEISNIDSIMYETILEIFTKKTDENNYLTIDGKKNPEVPINDGISLAKNIRYFCSTRINKQQEKIRLNIPIISYLDEESQEEVSLLLDKCDFEDFLQNGDETSQLALYGEKTDPEIKYARPAMYKEYLTWIKVNNIYDLFKNNANDIKAIIETILKCPDTFDPENVVGDRKCGFGLKFVTQKELQTIIEFRCGVYIDQENLSKDLKEIEQRLLDHLFYSLNYEIGKAPESKGLFKKESERFLYERDEKAFYNDLNKEDINNKLDEFTKKGFCDWESRCWEAELNDEKLKLRVWASKDIKNPIRYTIDRENLEIYRGLENYYFCDTEKMMCYILPTERRFIARSNKKHEIIFKKIK